MQKVKKLATIALSVIAINFIYQVATKSFTNQGGDFKRYADESEANVKRMEEAFAESHKRTQEEKELEELKFRFDTIEAKHKDAITRIKMESNKTKTCIYQSQYETVLSEDCQRRLNEVRVRMENEFSANQPTNPANESATTAQISEQTNSTFSFNFPLPSCGDSPSSGTEAWYPVFVDGGDLKTIRSNYCADAVSTKREDTGVATIQAASFTNYEKALSFARQIGGDVGQSTASE